LCRSQNVFAPRQVRIAEIRAVFTLLTVHFYADGPSDPIQRHVVAAVSVHLPVGATPDRASAGNPSPDYPLGLCDVEQRGVPRCCGFWQASASLLLFVFSS
jgi:hypothetical protein